MTAAIDLFGAVYTTAGGTRYHADYWCPALNNGREFWAARAGDYGGREPGPLYPLKRRSVLSATQFSYTACLVCVPAADALPQLPFVTGETYGHEPVAGEGWFGEPEDICARCTELGLYWGDPAHLLPVHVLWPCTSAVVLGLVARRAVTS